MKGLIQTFHHTKENEKSLNKKILQLLLIFHLYHTTMKKYKSNYNKRNNQVILLMINDENNNRYYFAVKNLSELNSLGWLMGKKEAIINGDNDFQNALHDALNYQTIEKDPQRISKLKPYINKYNWEGIEFPAGPKEWRKFERNNKKIALDVLHIPHNIKTSVAYRSEYNNKRGKQVIL